MTHFQATAGANANGSWCRRCCSCSVGGSARREPLSVCLCYRNPFGCGKPSPLPRNLCPVPNPINGHRGKKERAASVYQRRGEKKNSTDYAGLPSTELSRLFYDQVLSPKTDTGAAVRRKRCFAITCVWFGNIGAFRTKRGSVDRTLSDVSIRVTGLRDGGE